MSDLFYKVRHKETNRFISYFAGDGPVYGTGDSMFNSGQTCRTQEVAQEWLRTAAMDAIFDGSYIDMSEFEIVEVMAYPSRTLPVDDIYEKFVLAEQHGTEMDVLCEMLVFGVKNGFGSMTEAFCEKIFTETKYASIVKECVPTLMITEWRDYINDGLYTLTSEQLSAILMLCTDEVSKLYSLERIIDVAIKEEQSISK